MSAMELDLTFSYIIPHLPIIALWVAFFFACEYLTYAISPYVSEGYTKLDKRNQVGWSNRVVSTIHAIIVCPIAIYILFTDFHLRHDVGIGLPLCYSLIQIAHGYFTWDLCQCLLHFKEFGLAFLVHALACLGVYTSLLQPMMHVYGSIFLLYELSTPFINLVWLLKNHGVTNPLVFTVLGVCTLVVFFVIRLLLGIFTLVEVWINVVLNSDCILHIVYRAYFGVSSFSLTVLNVFWFYKMLMYMMRVSKKE